MTHTPLCSRDCSIKHHDVVTLLQAVAPRFNSSSNESFPRGPVPITRGNTKGDFKKQVQKLHAQGWSKDKEVPEPCEILKLPLLHLACMFGKHEVVEWLLDDEGYDAKLKTSISQETALHVVARHLYTALSPSGSRLENMSITAKVANFEKIVSLLIEKEVCLFWAMDALKRETAFHILAKQLLQASSSSVDVESEKEDLCLSFFANSLDVILKLLLAEETTRLKRKDIKHTLGIKNSEGDTALHYLARAYRQGYLVLRFLVKYLGNNDLLKIKNSNGLSAMDIVKQVYPGHERDLLMDEEGGHSVQDSSAVSLSSGMEQRETNIPVIAIETPPLTERSHPPMSPRQSQVQVQSIQFQGQPVLTGNPSLQPSAVAPPAQHIPVIFIKEEPVDLQHDTQCFYSVNNQVVSPPQRRNRSTFHPASTVATIGLDPLAVQEAGRGGGQQMLPLVPPGPASSQPFGVVSVAKGNSLESVVTTQSTGSRSLQNAQPAVSPSQNQRGRIDSGPRGQSRSHSTHGRGIKSSTLNESTTHTGTSYTIDSSHTPFCSRNCSLEHHHLVLTLSSSSNRVYYKRSKFQQPQFSRTNFANCLRKNLNEGFNKNSDMLDRLEKLQYPLVHLAGIFFKYSALDTLSYFGFDLNVCSQRTGEFPLHAVLHHGFEAGMKVYKGLTFMNTSYGEKLFSKVLSCLTSMHSVIEVLSQQDRNGDTPFLVAAKHVIATSVLTISQQGTAASEGPDSTQECSGGNSQVEKSLQNCSAVCNSKKANKHQRQAEYYMGCIGVMIKKLHESCIGNRGVDLSRVKKILLLENNDGETFLQVLCKEHHIAATSIAKVLSKFPLDTFSDCVKKFIPESCWQKCIPAERRAVKQRVVTDIINGNETVTSPLGTSPTSKRKEDGQTSLMLSSDGSAIQPSPTTNMIDSEKGDAQRSYSTPVPSTPLARESLRSVSPLDAMLTPVLANPSQATLRPNTKRKIIDALKEDYSERLELAIKGRLEVEGDILKHKKKTRELTEMMSKKREVMQKMERELQELQKEIWHENQAVQALESSFEQFTKEEHEMQKNLAVLHGVDPEPAAKKSKTSDQGSGL